MILALFIPRFKEDYSIQHTFLSAMTYCVYRTDSVDCISGRQSILAFFHHTFLCDVCTPDTIGRHSMMACHFSGRQPLQAHPGDGVACI